MSSAGGAVSNTQFLGKLGYNWHGSYPVFVADAKFEPNFRMFNMVSDVSLSNEDLHNKLLRSDDGTRPEQAGGLHTLRARGWPVIYSSLAIGLTTAAVSARGYRMRTTAVNLWNPIKWTAVTLVVGNLFRYAQRERQFNADFERNQYYAYEEIKAKRDEIRVRKAIEDKQYANDPLTEYRVKAWQVSRAGL